MQLQVTGQLVGMEPRSNGWVAVVIQDPGSNYPVKMSTKQPALLQQAQQLIMQSVTALYTESPSNNINPNTGEPYMNRNLNQLTLANGAAPAAPQQDFTPQPVQQPIIYSGPVQTASNIPQAPRVEYQRPKSPEETAQIHRQTASKVAVNLIGLLDKEDQNLAALIRISEQLVGYYQNGVNWSVPAPVPSPTPVAQPNPQPHPPAEPSYLEYPADPGPQGIPPDDDIPF